MYHVEDGTLAGPGLSFFETVLTFLVIPTAMFLVISLLAYLMVSPRKKNQPKESVVTHIE